MDMTAEYHFGASVDAIRNLIVVRVTGEMPAKVFEDRLFAFYDQLETPWNYNRLLDFRRLDGNYSDADVKSMMGRWAQLTAGISYTSKIAALSNNPRDKERVPVAAAPIYPGQTIRGFNDYDTALDWLTAP